jgi:hypothetical protein
MKKTLASLVIAASALVATAPATAQFGAPRPGWDQRDVRAGGQIGQRLDRIALRIDRGFQRGALTRGEAQRLRNQLNDIARLERRYSRNGLDRREFQDLNRRLTVLERRVQNQRFDNDRRRW